jgi:hypothetical protein
VIKARELDSMLRATIHLSYGQKVGSLRLGIFALNGSGVTVICAPARIFSREKAQKAQKHVE